MKLEYFFKIYPKAAIAFSGGVDSAYLLYAALRYGADVRAYYVKSQFQPQFEWDDAIRLSEQLHTEITVIPLDVLSCDRVAANPPDRCYHCKKQIFQMIADAALQDGFTVLLDGTNASDKEGDRPGMKALKEQQVLSPLRDCGLTKGEIRRLSKEAGLFTWDKPAYACLATRIPAGEAITQEKLYAAEKAEQYLFSLDFTDFRVRSEDGHARLQVPQEQMESILAHRIQILEKLKPYYKTVSLDLEVR